MCRGSFPLHVLCLPRDNSADGLQPIRERHVRGGGQFSIKGTGFCHSGSSLCKLMLSLSRRIKAFTAEGSCVLCQSCWREVARDINYESQEILERCYTDRKRTQCQSRLLYPVKLSITIDGETKALHDKIKFTHYISTNPALQRIITEKKNNIRTETMP